MNLSFGSLDTTYFLNNSASSYIESLILALLIFTALVFVKRFILWRFSRIAQNTDTNIDDALIHLIRSIKLVFLAAASVYFATGNLDLPGGVETWIDVIFSVLLVYQIIQAIQIILREIVFMRFLSQRLDDSKVEAMVNGVFRATTNWILWLLGILVLVQNFGFNVTSLIAGFGIGGIAIAIAAQNILSDIFSSFSILFDKPFEIGDFIVVDGQMGVVKKIGLKTTRIQSLHGEEIILSNNQITSSRIQNYKRMEKRRVVLSIPVEYKTPNYKIKKIPNIIKESIFSVEKTKFDRAHLKDLGDVALLFETIFYVLSSDYSVYMDAKQSILFNIKEKFEKEGIPFAYKKVIILEDYSGEKDAEFEKPKD